MATPSNETRIANELEALARETTVRLEAVWNEVGYSPQERQRQLESLSAVLRAACSGKIVEEEGVRDHFLHAIRESRAEARGILAALGESDSSAASDVAFEAPNLTETLAHLECLLEGLRARRTERREQLKRVQDAVFLLYEDLGEVPEPEVNDIDTDLRDARILFFEAKRNELSCAVEHRAQTVAELALSCQALMAQLKLDPATELDVQVAGSVVRESVEDDHPEGAAPAARLASTRRTATCLGTGRAALDDVSRRQKELVAERDRRKEKLEKMGEEILELWQRLGVPQEEQERFSASVDGMGEATIAAGERELQRLRDLKACMLGELLARAKSRVEELWELTNTPQEERVGLDAEVHDASPFNAAGLDCARAAPVRGDELLAKLETEAERLSQLHESMKPLLLHVVEREALVAERWRHEVEERDSARLKGRGAEVTKALQRELELEKRVKKRLPMLNDRLRKYIAAWEEKAGRPFSYNGEPYIIRLERSEEEYAQLRDDLKAAKEAKKREERQRLLAAPAAVAVPQGNVVALARGASGAGSTAGKRAAPQSARKAGALHTPAASRIGAASRAPHTSGPELPNGGGASGRSLAEDVDSDKDADSLLDVSNRQNYPLQEVNGVKRSSSGSAKSSENSRHAPMDGVHTLMSPSARPGIG